MVSANQGMQAMFGVDGLVILVFFFTGLMAAWWALGALKWDKLFYHPMSSQVQMVRFFISLAGGLLACGVAVLLLGAMQILRAL